MAINDELSYEINERGQRVVVKSIESSTRVYLRFSNRTKHHVDVWWRDFQGVRRHYVRIVPGGHYNVNSFLTHPWEFTDASTKEKYYINGKDVFRAPANMGGINFRTNWNISIGMRTLRSTALLAIAMRIPDPESVIDLELPLGLQYELQELVRKLNDLNPVPGE